MKDKSNASENLVWVQFWDMHSGGGTKEPPYEKIYIEAKDQEAAALIFYNRFGHSPERVSCTCCGGDYSISFDKDLAQLTGYHRDCIPVSGPKRAFKYLEEGQRVPKGWKVEKRYGHQQYTSMEDYIDKDDILVIHNSDVSNEEKQGEVPEQGYVWAG